MTETINEDAILIRMQEASREFQSLLKKLIVIRKEIDASVDALDNNYFVEKTDIFKKFSDIFNDQGIDQLSSYIDQFCMDINDELATKCSNHEFVDDSADVGYEDTVYFSYCKNCHMTKKV